MLRLMLAAELLGTAIDVATHPPVTMAPMAVVAASTALALAILGGLWTAVAAGVAALAMSLAAASGMRLTST
ncbi:MAG TPA: hypothetical protein VMF13_06410, partial [Luteitalea sp.]|nr:hypothetical protein [Luteitalea sp.]